MATAMAKQIPTQMGKGNEPDEAAAMSVFIFGLGNQSRAGRGSKSN